MTKQPLRDFALEVFFSEWEFTAKHHMTASDVESMSLTDLLALASDDDKTAFEHQWLGYTQTYGAPELRAVIADSYKTMSADNILCHAGASEAIYAVAKVLLTDGDHVIVPVPNYQSAESVPLTLCDVSSVPINYKKDGAPHDWHLSLDAILDAIRPETKMISLNMPNNPTGHIMPLDDVMALIEQCRKRGIYIFCDEVYRGIELDETNQIPQIADLYERGISLNVMSKAYGLPGLRIGWIASADKALLQKVERYKHYLSICNSGPSEMLSLIALKAGDSIISRNKKIMADNLALLTELFHDFPDLFEFSAPLGGCVAFPKFTGAEGGAQFCQKAITQSGILLLPSSIYASQIGTVPDDHFRIGFGRDKVVKDGIAALRSHLERYYGEYHR